MPTSAAPQPVTASHRLECALSKSVSAPSKSVSAPSKSVSALSKSVSVPSKSVSSSHRLCANSQPQPNETVTQMNYNRQGYTVFFLLFTSQSSNTA